jgi:XRE family transcriptional regulator, regulator of sulfur utilization
MAQAGSLGGTIRQLREQRGLSMAELARRVGCYYQTLANIEYGHRNPSRAMLHLIARELETDVATIEKAAA